MLVFTQGLQGSCHCGVEVARNRLRRVSRLGLVEPGHPESTLVGFPRQIVLCATPGAGAPSTSGARCRCGWLRRCRRRAFHPEVESIGDRAAVGDFQARAGDQQAVAVGDGVPVGDDRSLDRVQRECRRAAELDPARAASRFELLNQMVGHPEALLGRFPVECLLVGLAVYLAVARGLVSSGVSDAPATRATWNRRVHDHHFLLDDYSLDHRPLDDFFLLDDHGLDHSLLHLHSDRYLDRLGRLSSQQCPGRSQGGE